MIEPHLPLPAGRDRQRAFKKTSAGFNVALAVDAMTDTRSEAHEYSLRNVFPRLGETGATDDIINLIAKRSA
ncbi:cysteine hydrolase family protein [Acidibrevibacterium fodinaquatile]|uniref:hypothetical protein n=1 Tax=Acidibrevibacterium fodinaquatile TaxID=1969806 RepID=UPI001964D6B4|nr:hypothetical protein [Acidibrevibacterium fodinaquatile]